MYDTITCVRRTNEISYVLHHHHTPLVTKSSFSNHKIKYETQNSNLSSKEVRLIHTINEHLLPLLLPLFLVFLIAGGIRRPLRHRRQWPNLQQVHAPSHSAGLPGMDLPAPQRHPRRRLLRQFHLTLRLGRVGHQPHLCCSNDRHSSPRCLLRPQLRPPCRPPLHPGCHRQAPTRPAPLPAPRPPPPLLLGPPSQ